MTTRKWGNELLVTNLTPGNQDQSSVTALVDGGFVVTWRDDAPVDSVIRWQRYDAAGVKVGSEVTLSSSGLDQSLPTVTQLDDGTLWFAVQDFDSNIDDDIDGFVYSLTGTKLRDQAPQTSSANHQDPAIASLGSNGSVAVYYSPNDTNGDIKMTIFNAAGTATLSTVLANTTTTGLQFTPSVAGRSFGDLFTVVWCDQNTETVRGRVIDFTGTEREQEFVVGPSDFFGTATPVVTWLDSTRFAVVWQRALFYHSSVQIFQLTGDIGASVFEVTGEIQVNSIGISAEDPQIVGLPNGGFVIGWTTSSGPGDDGESIRLQAFDGLGNKLGGPILVNSTTTGGQESVSLAALADGRVAVTWTDVSSGNADVRMQIVDPRDGIIDGTTGVDKLYGHDSVGDIISANDGADTVFGLGGADTIYGGKGIDNLYGGRGDDTVYGGADNDILYGDLGDDEQYGEAGNDIIYSAGGADLMDGGAGTGDAAFYVNELLGATINLTDQLLTSGSALGDTLFNFERVYGSVRGSNNLTGDAQANILVGGLVADTLNGGGGADVLRGWGGVDTMSGGANNDIFQYTGNTEGGDIITDFAAGDKFQFVRTAFGNLAGANVAAVNFLSVASGHAATNASQRFIFDQATKQLWYDANGNVAGGDVMIADLSTSYNILNTDLLLA